MDTDIVVLTRVHVLVGPFFSVVPIEAPYFSHEGVRRQRRLAFQPQAFERVDSRHVQVEETFDTNIISQVWSMTSSVFT